MNLIKKEISKKNEEWKAKINQHEKEIMWNIPDQSALTIKDEELRIWIKNTLLSHKRIMKRSKNCWTYPWEKVN